MIDLLDLNPILRLIQLIPLILILIPLVNSYLIRKNKINGLRRVRVTLIILITSLIFSNIYFFLFSYFRISRTMFASQIVLLIEKIINIIAYWLLFYMFSRARIHLPTDMEAENHKNIKIIKKDVKKIKKR